jgi:hypothetical protein
MHNSQFWQFQPEGQGKKPVDNLTVQRRVILDFSQKGRVLLPVLLTPFRAVA